MTRRIAATALALCLLGTATAGAAIKAGFYKGKTAQQATVSLRVLKSKKFVVKYSLEGAVLECSDGQNRQFQGFTTGSSDRVAIKQSTGRFGFNIGNSDQSVVVRVKGRIKAPRATGTIRMVAALNEQDELDPNGSITCDSGSVPWSAKRR
jgi:hypothetical protein